MQKITLLGNVGRDLEDRRTSTGKRVLSFSLAVRSGKDVTSWYDIQIWEDRISSFQGMIPFIKKGSQLIIIGDFLLPETYLAKDGSTKIKLRIHPLSMNFVGSSQDKKEEPLFKTIDQQENDEVPF